MNKRCRRPMRRASLAIALLFPLFQSAELYARAIGEPEPAPPAVPPPAEKQPPPPAEKQPAPPEQPPAAGAPKEMELSTKILIGAAVALGLAAVAGGGGGGGGGGGSAPSSTSSGH